MLQVVLRRPQRLGRLLECLGTASVALEHTAEKMFVRPARRMVSRLWDILKVPKSSIFKIRGPGLSLTSLIELVRQSTRHG